MKFNFQKNCNFYKNRFSDKKAETDRYNAWVIAEEERVREAAKAPAKKQRFLKKTDEQAPQVPAPEDGEIVLDSDEGKKFWQIQNFLANFFKKLGNFFTKIF